MATKNVVKTVMVVPPMASPDTGRMLSWTSTHTPDCPVARNGVYMPVSGRRLPYQAWPVADVPAHVQRCGRCGGGR